MTNIVTELKSIDFVQECNPSAVTPYMSNSNFQSSSIYYIFNFDYIQTK